MYNIAYPFLTFYLPSFLQRFKKEKKVNNNEGKVTKPAMFTDYGIWDYGSSIYVVRRYKFMYRDFYVACSVSYVLKSTKNMLETI